MKIAKDEHAPSLDCVAAEDDHVDVVSYRSATGTVLTVNSNGITLVRIGHIKQRIDVSMEPGTEVFKMPDYAKLEQNFKDAVGTLPNYKRSAAWEFVKSLQQRIAKLD